jgi:DNA-directed RNA polymerase specialized sigma24 family protein
LGELARSAAAGDRQSLETLLARLAGPLRNYFREWLGNRRDGRDTAEDLMQEALIRILQAIGGCQARTDREVTGWRLFSVFSCVAVQHAGKTE